MDYARLLQDYGVWLLIGLIALPYLAMPCLIKCIQRFRRDFSLEEFGV
jgi:hypothetical protein